jgi:hypothetical protein
VKGVKGVNKGKIAFLFHSFTTFTFLHPFAPLPLCPFEMKHLLTIVLTAVLCSAAAGQSPRTASRARLPDFSAADAQEFFTDVFARLVGDRPRRGAAAQSPDAGAPASIPSRSSPAWSKLISATTIEDEIKSIKRSVDSSVTTLATFPTGAPQQLRRDYSVLATLFAVIHDYDGEVRWKHTAAAAQHTFSQAAAHAESADRVEVFREAQLRKADLEELLRGAGLGREVPPGERTWDGVASRSALMQRLQVAYEGRLGAWTSQPASFSDHAEMVLHEAEMTAALAEVILQPGMEDRDDETYAALARQMRDSAAEIAAAVQAKDHPRAQQAAAQLFRACAECHEGYR